MQAANDFGKQVLTAVPKRTKKSAPRKGAKIVHAPNLEKRRSSRVAGLPAKTYDENVLLGVDTNERSSRKVDFSGMHAVQCHGVQTGETQTINGDHLGVQVLQRSVTHSSMWMLWETMKKSGTCMFYWVMGR